jgi:hypothetical protein
MKTYKFVPSASSSIEMFESKIKSVQIAGEILEAKFDQYIDYTIPALSARAPAHNEEVSAIDYHSSEPD